MWTRHLNLQVLSVIESQLNNTVSCIHQAQPQQSCTLSSYKLPALSSSTHLTLHYFQPEMWPCPQVTRKFMDYTELPE